MAWYQLSTPVKNGIVPVVHPCQKWHGISCPPLSKMASFQLSTPVKNAMVPVVHPCQKCHGSSCPPLSKMAWFQLFTPVKNGMVPVVHPCQNGMVPVVHPCKNGMVPWLPTLPPSSGSCNKLIMCAYVYVTMVVGFQGNIFIGESKTTFLWRQPYSFYVSNAYNVPTYKVEFNRHQQAVYNIVALTCCWMAPFIDPWMAIIHIICKS